MGSGGECSKQLEQHVQSPESLLRLRNYALVLSSPDRADPWILASLAARALALAWSRCSETAPFFLLLLP